MAEVKVAECFTNCPTSLDGDIGVRWVNSSLAGLEKTKSRTSVYRNSSSFRLFVVRLFPTNHLPSLCLTVQN